MSVLVFLSCIGLNYVYRYEHLQTILNSPTETVVEPKTRKVCFTGDSLLDRTMRDMFWCKHKNPYSIVNASDYEFCLKSDCSDGVQKHQQWDASHWHKTPARNLNAPGRCQSFFYNCLDCVEDVIDESNEDLKACTEVYLECGQWFTASEIDVSKMCPLFQEHLDHIQEHLVSIMGREGVQFALEFPTSMARLNDEVADCEKKKHKGAHHW
eukprot:CAMPEP_0167743552 /NCGR_PEP_ID=MMETSP0110_2-20121227/2078_1 /TAXON_ID=629695 /ORGANISM="Gymnochlora sp., Strain CCMP2014" /LENGTH=210 /DNA_ID=CAMNT_0007627933 /DNA_START=288 /DNA_END=917 /DNA_ORIENTATION=-